MRRVFGFVLLVLLWCGSASARRTPPPRVPLWVWHYAKGSRLIEQHRWHAAAGRLRQAIRLQPEPRRHVRLPDGKTVDYAPYALLAYALARAGAPRAVVEPILRKSEQAGVAPPDKLERLRELLATLPKWRQTAEPPPRSSTAAPSTPTPAPTPTPTPVPAAVFLVDGVPADITLVIDGEPLPPGVRETTLPPGLHTVAARRDGELLERARIRFAPGQRLGIAAAVTPRPTATPTATPTPHPTAVLLDRGTRSLISIAVAVALFVGVSLAWRRRASSRRDEGAGSGEPPTLETPSDVPPPGTVPVEQVPGYRIEARLGAGGMATTYRARRLADGKVVAIKIPHESALADPASRRRFVREARLGEQLHHPNVVRVIEAGEQDGRPFLVMELVQGRTLRELIATAGPLPLERALDFARQVAEALDYAHAKGVIHRDLKPENLLVERDGTVRVMDFGIARPLQGGTALTGTSAFVGTPLYAAPEMIAGGPVDHRADLYALGVVILEMLEGKAPFAGLAPLEQLKMHLEGRFPNRYELERPLPEPVWELVTRLTARDPQDRPSSAQEVLLELKRLQRLLEEGRLG